MLSHQPIVVSHHGGGRAAAEAGRRVGGATSLVGVRGGIRGAPCADRLRRVAGPHQYLPTLSLFIIFFFKKLIFNFKVKRQYFIDEWKKDKFEVSVKEKFWANVVGALFLSKEDVKNIKDWKDTPSVLKSDIESWAGKKNITFKVLIKILLFLFKVFLVLQTKKVNNFLR